MGGGKKGEKARAPDPQPPARGEGKKRGEERNYGGYYKEFFLLLPSQVGSMSTAREGGGERREF